jgi:hypothetical protein
MAQPFSSSKSMKRTNDTERIVDFGESMADSASPNLYAAWIAGVAVALAIAVYGVICICNQSALFISRGAGLIQYRGAGAVALGVAYLSCGCFLHFHYYWSWRERFFGYAQIGKTLAMLGVAGGIVYLVVSVLVFG